jgi:bacteriorhodopsin
MLFVYIHILWFGYWIGFGVEDYPFGLLTMIVSLEAIFSRPS